MDDKYRAVLQDFITEARDHLQVLEPDLLALEQSGDPDPDVVNRIFRSVHSIKGASGFFNLKNINELAHVMESLLMKLRDKSLGVSSELVDALLAGSDRLSAMVDDVENADSFDISAEKSRLVALLDAANGKPAETAKPAAAASAPPIAAPALAPTPAQWESCQASGRMAYLIRLDADVDLRAGGRSALDVLDQLKTVGECLASDPSREKLESHTDAANVWILGASVLEKDLFAMALRVADDQVSRVEPPAALPAGNAEVVVESVSTPIPASMPPSTPRKVNGTSPANGKTNASPADAPESAATASRGQEGAETLRVSVSLLNHLLNLAGELVLSRNQLTQLLIDRAGEIRGLNSVLQNLNLVTGELQESIMYTRMQPVGGVFNKFPRIMRDLAKKLDKDIELEIQGGDVELDKSIIESLSDPLTHLIRNTADHGIESREDREKAGKPRVGRVLLRAFHEAGLVNIEISDDGNGIDPSVIRRKAVEKAVVSAEAAARMSDREVLNLIFAPGFSTAAQVTDVSGRGVGMDVVKTNIERLGGTVELDSTKGEGTRVRLRLPLTLAIIPSLLIGVGEEKFAVPQVSIVELVRIRARDASKSIKEVNGAEVLRLRDQLLPLVRLSEVLGIRATYVDPETNDECDERRMTLVDRRAPDGEPNRFRVDGETGELVAINGGAQRSHPDRRGGPDRRFHSQSAINILVLVAGTNQFGLIVDRVFDNEEIVVKPLSKYVKENSCYSGTTIMGEGRVAMILDAKGISDTAKLAFEDVDRANVAMEQDAMRNGLRERQTVLLFRNGPEEIFAMSLSLITRIEKVPLGDIERVGDREFIKYRGGAMRLVRLHHHLPVSAPASDGAFLYVIVPKLMKTAVGIVATEVVNVLETEIDLDTTNRAEGGIMGSAIVNERITLVLDTFALMEKADPEYYGAEAPIRRAEGSYRILLAEDTPFFRQLERDYMESAGYAVDTVRDGEEALEALMKTHYDLVVSDIVMPRMDGFELVRRIRGSGNGHAGVPVLALTSLTDEKSRDLGTKSGFTDYAVKIDKAKLLETIHNLLQSATRAA
ncbi:MAG: chemotaxis protein CheW [Deltaproteobacteria bacterium]|nr:chemotaxis protein CheW [Deltaproteobacteria bacterium]